MANCGWIPGVGADRTRLCPAAFHQPRPSTGAAARQCERGGHLFQREQRPLGRHCSSDLELRPPVAARRKHGFFRGRRAAAEFRSAAAQTGPAARASQFVVPVRTARQAPSRPALRPDPEVCAVHGPALRRLCAAETAGPAVAGGGGLVGNRFRILSHSPTSVDPNN